MDKSMGTRAPISKFKREPKKLSNFVLTDRDLEILRALSLYRYLSVSQIRRLFFPNSKNSQATNNRLRKLFHSGLINKVAPYTRLGQPMSEFVYFLDKKGARLIEDKGILPVHNWRKAKEVKYQFLQHALDLSTFRINLELGLKKQNVVRLKTFIPDFQMKKSANQYVSKHRYQLYTTLVSPHNRRSYVIYPDALIVFTAEHNKKTLENLYFLEIDRGTHGLEAIREKVHGYYLYHTKGLHRNIVPGLADFKVLFQTNSQKRADNIREILGGYYGSERVWVTDYPSVNENSLLFEEVWQNVAGQAKRILNVPKADII